MRDNFFLRLSHLRDRGFDARQVLDVGAYKGAFARFVRGIFPSAEVHMFEANQALRGSLEETAAALGNCTVNIGLLGSEPGGEASFYSIPESRGIPATGSSIFRERTIAFADPIVEKLRVTTIDEWFASQPPGPAGEWREHGLVKLDVQGAELEVLRGAQRFIREGSPRFYALEVSVQQYNEGAPLMDEVVAFMSTFARTVDVLDVLYDAAGSLLQLDLLFERK